jgi:hypothetical protein
MLQKRFLTLAALAVASILAAGSHVQAAPGDFTYTSTAVDPITHTPLSPPTVTSTSGETTVTLLGSTGGGTTPTQIVFGNSSITSTAPVTAPDSFSLDYAYEVAITDTTSGLTGSVFLQGTLSGKAASTASLVFNTYTAPLSGTVTLGNQVYTVTDFAFTPPSVAGALPGSFSAFVTSTTVPEPTSVVLLGLGGVGALGLLRRRKASV